VLTAPGCGAALPSAGADPFLGPGVMSRFRAVILSVWRFCHGQV
jgi:hypothetical protein